MRCIDALLPPTVRKTTKSYARPTLTSLGGVETLTLVSANSKGTGGVIDGGGQYKPIVVIQKNYKP